MLAFVTGISISGKSTMVTELSRRGYEAHDLEHNGMSAWFHKQTGTRDAEFGQVPERTKAWMDAHEWRVSVDRVSAIAGRVGERIVFLCGGGANEQAVIELCDAVIWLQTDEATIRQRVTAPRDHTYGTKPHELIAIIEGNQRKEQYYRALGAMIIDARRPMSVVADDIVER